MKDLTQTDSISDLLDLFFRDMKDFNKNNFKSIHTADLPKVQICLYINRSVLSLLVISYFAISTLKYPRK